MDTQTVPGTEGYADHARQLIARYGGVPFLDKYRPVLQLLPALPCAVLDIGAGTGADAAWLASAGHTVTAVEPVAAFREAGMRAHARHAIAWVDDSLPALPGIAARGARYELILVTAVWMHLAAQERVEAMQNVSRLLDPGALLVVSLRHGPAPAGRRMFAVTARETIDLALRNGLQLLLSTQAPSVQARNRYAGVCWSWLAFQK